jgi:hypothetical protein
MCDVCVCRATAAVRSAAVQWCKSTPGTQLLGRGAHCQKPYFTAHTVPVGQGLVGTISSFAQSDALLSQAGRHRPKGRRCFLRCWHMIRVAGKSWNRGTDTGGAYLRVAKSVTRSRAPWAVASAKACCWLLPMTSNSAKPPDETCSNIGTHADHHNRARRQHKWSPSPSPSRKHAGYMMALTKHSRSSPAPGVFLASWESAVLTV